MASEDLLKKAVAAFNALLPEQQAEMLEEQRQSWVRGNVGLSRDERGMTSPVMPRPAPAATDTGLVTVETQVLGENGWTEDGFLSKNLLPHAPRRELVTRSQAEELLAAERAESERLRAYILRAEKAEADNAAKDARIKALEADRDHQSKLSNKLNRSHAVLEAKLAAALQKQTDDMNDFVSMTERAETAEKKLEEANAEIWRLILKEGGIDYDL